MSLTVRSTEDSDHGWVVQLLRNEWNGPTIGSRGRVFQGDELPGFVAFCEGKRQGLATYHIEDDACELVSLNSLFEGIGIGSALIEAVRKTAVEAGCKRLWLITTNDNTSALRFYQRRGFRLAALHKGSVTELRKLKPKIPMRGIDDIAIRDEIELDFML